jgi:hypothetical protein
MDRQRSCQLLYYAGIFFIFYSYDSTCKWLTLIRIISLCIHIWSHKAFRNLFSARIYSTELRWWKVHLNYWVSCMKLMWTQFCNWFLWAVSDSDLDSKLKLLPMKALSIWVGISMLRTIYTGALLIWGRRLYYAITTRRLVGGMPLLLHKYCNPHFWTERYVSDILQPSLLMKRRHFICDGAAAHTANYSINVLNDVL